jgi:chromosome segregation ATPase
MSIPAPSAEPTSSTATLENIVFWIASLVALAFVALTIVKFGTVVETIRSTKQEAVTEQARLTSVTNQLADVQPRFEAAQAAISQSRATLSGFESDVAKKRDELKIVDAALTEKTAAVDAADKRLAELKEQIAQAEKAANAPVDEARRTLAELNSQIELRNNELRALKERFASLSQDAEKFTQRKREFCSVIRVALHAQISIVNRLRPAAEYCGLPVPASPELGPG